MITKTLITTSPEETQRLAMDLARFLEPGDILLLSGGLGAGKTCFTQGVAWGLGVKEHARSPTFVLISEYQGRLTLYHIDLFRLDDVAEMADLGLEDYLDGDGVCAIEWAEKAIDILPDEGLWVRFRILGPQTRSIALEARGARYEAILQGLSWPASNTVSAQAGG